MTSFRLRRLAIMLAPLMSLPIASPAKAQVMVAPATPNADRLAEQVRILAADPRNVGALLQAGELSTRLEDPAAAMAFFARAAAIDPGNPRVAAGRAGALVLLERPGEALKLYADAERAGVSMAPYWVQRGLAYDLIGQPGYAQRDYRAALARGTDDEGVRRLALSLGISGKRDEALAVLDPLLRRSDRGAWRARAFILAAGGDPAGGERIAANMMSGGAALGHFLRRLPALSLADRAFAVHFGELNASVARRNDARLAPALTPLVETPPVVAAVSAPALTRAPTRQDDRQARRTSRREPVVIASRPGRMPLTALPTRATSASTPTPTPTPTPAQPVAVASASPLQIFTPPQPSVVARPLATGAPSPVASVIERPVTAAPAPTPVRSAPPPAIQPAVSAPAPQPAPAQADSPPQQTTAQPAPLASPILAVAAAAPTPQTVTIARVAPPVRSGLDSIIGTISVPAAELDVLPAARPVPAVVRVAPRRVAPAKPAPKIEPVKSDPAEAEPPRWWAQVAGGARVADLDRDWSRLAAKSPAAFRSKGAWTTPVRATNRLLAGPFKSQLEAQGFVNAIGKDGLSAFAWQSEAGQKIARLAVK